MESRWEVSAAAMAARRPAPPPPITRTSCRRPSSPGIARHSFLVEVTAIAVVHDDRGKALRLETADRLGAEVFVGDDLDLLDELREHRPRPADRPEVHALVLCQRVLHRLRARALPHRPLEPELQQRRRELVHPPPRRRADGTDDVARPCWRRTGVINDLPLDIERQPLPLL